MKHFFIALAFTFINLSICAQDKTVNKIEIAISKNIEILRQGLMTADAAKLASITSKDLSYGHSSGNMETQMAFIDNVVKKKSNVISLEFQNQTISVIDNVALVRHTFVSKTLDAGVEKETKIGVLQVWKKTKNEWLMIARQAFKLPQ